MNRVTSRSFKQGQSWVLMSALAALLALGSAVPARGVESFRPYLSKVSQEIGKYLRGEHATNVVLGAVTGEALYQTSKGPGLKKILGEELTKQGIALQDDATFEVTLDYRVTKDTSRSEVEGLDIPQILLSVNIINRSTGGRCLQALAIRDQVDASAEQLKDLICELFGIDTGDQGAGLSIKQFVSWFDQEKIEWVVAAKAAEDRIKQGQQPEPFQQTGPYRLAVLVQTGDGYEERPLENGGCAQVQLQRGEQYAIKLINDADHEVAVTLTIDGLNAFMFSKYPYRHFIVGKKSSLLVKGWHRTNASSDAFVITRYAESQVAKTLSNPSDAVGTITAQFAACWETDAAQPADEKGQAKSPEGIATGGGPATPSKFAEVRRRVGRTRATMNIRYTKPPVAAVRPAAEARMSNLNADADNA